MWELQKAFTNGANVISVVQKQAQKKGVTFATPLVKQ